MKKNQLIGIVLTVLAIGFLAYQYWPHENDPMLSNEPIEDKRFEVTEQNDTKYQSSVLINTTENKEEWGTAYVAGKNTVVTNKHVVESIKNEPDKAVVKIKKDGKVIDFKIKKFTLAKKDEIDVAILTLEKDAEGKSIGDYKKIVSFGDINAVKEGTNLTVVGFPGDKPYNTMWDSTGEVDMVMDQIISFRAITAPGNSGSPLFNEKGEVVGMNNAGGENNSFGFLMTQDILDFINENIE